MKKESTAKYLCLLAAPMLLTGFEAGNHPGVSGTSEKEQEAKRPPNIIFMLADDYRHDDFSFMGGNRAYTPNIDRMAARSTIFDNAYVTTSICAVSRVSILTGMYARRHGIYGFKTPIPEEQWQKCYPMMFRKSGYRTGFIGKYGVNVWVPDKQYPVEDFDYWFCDGPGQKLYLKDEEGRDVHFTRMMGMKAVEFLNEYRDEPFCLSISFLAAHGSLDPDPTFNDMFLDETVAIPENYGEYYFQKLPEIFREYPNFGHVNFEKRSSCYDSLQDFHRERKRRIYGLDMAVGRILHELEALGLEDNTIIIFSGDNGYQMGEHGLNGKWFMYEKSVRVPMMVYDPRLPESMHGQHLDEVVLNIDIGPTMMDYAGLVPHASVQGRNFRPLVEGNEIPDWREEFYYEQHFDLRWGKEEVEGTLIPPVEGVVTERFKYVNYFRDGGEELYDWREDPWEKNNLIDDPAYSMILEMMREKYKKMKAELK